MALAPFNLLAVVFRISSWRLFAGSLPAAVLAGWIRLQFGGNPDVSDQCELPPAIQLSNQVRQLRLREQRAADSVWAPEILAQRCGRTVEAIWDEINDAEDKLARVAELNLGTVLVGWWRLAKTKRLHGIEIYRRAGEDSPLPPSEWTSWVRGFWEAGWRLEWIEFRHQRFLVNGNHGFLRNFYASHLPYTEEFEQMHDIIKEELGELADDTVLQGMVFDRLKKHHHAMAKDPESIRWKNVKRTIPPPEPELLPSMLESLTPEQFAVYRALPGDLRRAMTRELRHSRDQEMRRRIEAYHKADTTEIVDVTWGEEAQEWKDSIIAELIHPHFFEPEWDESWIHEEQARALVERLVNEIPADGFLEMEGGDLIYYGKYEKELKPGDKLLIK